MAWGPGIMKMFEEAQRKASLEYKYGRKSYLSDLDPKSLLYLVLAVGRSSDTPPSWVIDECLRIYNFYESFADPDTLEPFGIYPSDAVIMDYVAIYYVKMRRDPRLRGKRILRAAIIQALGGKDKARASDVRRIYRHWEKHTKERGRRLPSNPWIPRALYFLDLQEALKNMPSYTLCYGCETRIAEDGSPELTLTVGLGDDDEESVRNLALCSPECAPAAVARLKRSRDPEAEHENQE